MRLAEAVNCPHDENNIAEVAECLRNKEAKTLVYNEWGSLGKSCFCLWFGFVHAPSLTNNKSAHTMSSLAANRTIDTTKKYTHTFH